MRTWVNRIAVILLLLCSASAALADISVGKKDQTPEASGPKVNMIVTRNYKATEAQLVIPRSMLQSLQAGQAWDDPRYYRRGQRGLSVTGAQTAIAGLFLSAAFVFAGLWFVRSRKSLNPAGRAAVGIIALVILGAAGGMAYANAGPPPAASRSFTSAILAPEVRNWGVSGQVRIVLTDENGPITLILPDKK